MKQISFSHNWNDKLLGHGIFTTIRKSNPQKRKYYGEAIGEVFDIILDDGLIGKAKLLDIWSAKFSEINPPLLMMDTGMKDLHDIEKLFNKFSIKKNDTVMVLILKMEAIK